MPVIAATIRAGTAGGFAVRTKAFVTPADASGW